MDLAWIEKRLPTINEEAIRQPLSNKTTSMLGLLDQMVKTVRKISAELRPGVLDDLGLVPAMEWQARDWQVRTGHRVPRRFGRKRRCRAAGSRHRLVSHFPGDPDQRRSTRAGHPGSSPPQFGKGLARDGNQ